MGRDSWAGLDRQRGLGRREVGRLARRASQSAAVVGVARQPRAGGLGVGGGRAGAGAAVAGSCGLVAAAPAVGRRNGHLGGDPAERRRSSAGLAAAAGRPAGAFAVAGRGHRQADSLDRCRAGGGPRRAAGVAALAEIGRAHV